MDPPPPLPSPHRLRVTRMYHARARRHSLVPNCCRTHTVQSWEIPPITWALRGCRRRWERSRLARLGPGQDPHSTGIMGHPHVAPRRHPIYWLVHQMRPIIVPGRGGGLGNWRTLPACATSKKAANLPSSIGITLFPSLFTNPEPELSIILLDILLNSLFPASKPA